ncbi:hypothetical protein D3C86_1680720 [compost metagenome]
MNPLPQTCLGKRSVLLVKTHDNQFDLPHLVCGECYGSVELQRLHSASGTGAELLRPLQIPARRINNTPEFLTQQRAYLRSHMAVAANYNNICPHPVLLPLSSNV